jgi:hypothetical protein
MPYKSLIDSVVIDTGFNRENHDLISAIIIGRELNHLDD